LTNEKLYALFKEFDHEDIEVLTIHNIKGAFLRMGNDVSIQEIESMLSEHKVPKDGFIDFEQFKQIILASNTKDTGNDGKVIRSLTTPS
jgi:calcium-dependent protein kinase